MKLSPEPQIDSASGKKPGCETFRLKYEVIKEYCTSIELRGNLQIVTHFAREFSRFPPQLQLQGEKSNGFCA